MKPLVISSTLVLLAGCSTIQLPETVNDSHSTAAKQSQQSLVATQWQAPHQAGALQRDLTQVLKTPALNQLIQTALRNNPDLGQSALRLKEQGLLVRQVRAAQLPAISLDGLRTQTGEGSSTTAKSYQIGFSSSWEIDLWGRLADETRTAKLDQAALQADHQAARNSLASQVARHWVSLAAQKQIISLEQQRLNNLQKLERSATLRFQSGLDTTSTAQLAATRQSVANYPASVNHWLVFLPQ